MRGTPATNEVMSANLPAETAILNLDDVPFMGIIEQSLAGVYVVLDERFMYANDTFAAMFGYGREEFIGRRVVECVTSESVPEVMENYRRRISGEVASIHYITQGLRKDGQIVHLELHASRVMCRGRPALAGVALDITERVRRREELRELSRRLDTAREVERTRLARDVHDVLGGMLSSAKFDVARIARRCTTPEQAELHGIAADLSLLLQETIDTARAISHELRPASLDLLGLEAALRQDLQGLSRRLGIASDVQVRGGPIALAPEVCSEVYRIVQEGLTNIGRHAQASRVALTIEQSAETFELHLVDDGRGIGSRPANCTSLGMAGMQERAAKIGAEFVLQPAVERGTELMLRLRRPRVAS